MNNEQSVVRKMYGTKKPYIKGSFAFVYKDEDGKRNSVLIPFSKGVRSPRFIPGRFVTSDPFLQKAIEASRNFGRMYMFIREMPSLKRGEKDKTDPGKNVFKKVHQHGSTTGVIPQEPSEVVIEIEKPTVEQKTSEVAEAPIIASQDDNTGLPEGFVIPMEGLEDITSGSQARLWLRKNLPFLTSDQVSNNTRIIQLAGRYSIEFPKWNP